MSILQSNDQQLEYHNRLLMQLIDMMSLVDKYTAIERSFQEHGLDRCAL